MTDVTTSTTLDTLPGAASSTDPLTGFGDRSRLFDDLTDALAPTAPPAVFVIFGLDGYGEYLRVHGQVEADRLLQHLAQRLARKLGSIAACYRPRRDEFAALLHAPLDAVQPALEASLGALRKRGRAANVSGSFGAVVLPDEAEDATEAMMLADERLALAARARSARGHSRATR